jgi:hypothetical protein
MPSELVKFNMDDPWQSQAFTFLSLWCGGCLVEFEFPGWGATDDSFYQWCADTAERAKAANWVLLNGWPYCPRCAVLYENELKASKNCFPSRQPSSPTNSSISQT